MERLQTENRHTYRIEIRESKTDERIHAMNKNKFLAELSRKLRRLPKEDYDDAMKYYTKIIEKYKTMPE